jgi:hypothetical protein
MFDTHLLEHIPENVWWCISLRQSDYCGQWRWIHECIGNRSVSCTWWSDEEVQIADALVANLRESYTNPEGRDVWFGAGWDGKELTCIYGVHIYDEMESVMMRISCNLVWGMVFDGDNDDCINHLKRVYARWVQLGGGRFGWQQGKKVMKGWWWWCAWLQHTPVPKRATASYRMMILWNSQWWRWERHPS